ncbi:hypothetical protein ACMGDH_15555 [Sphingomonas sp. DT-207]|uniref:hypothetical protein n=1 Tax=Sphingomonas sp. DT-207 TaxID=3396167 RepID=UPI003F1B83A5
MRRTITGIVVIVVAGCVIGAAAARVSFLQASGTLQIDGFHLTGAEGLTPAQIQMVTDQVHMVSRLKIKPEIAEFFRSQPIRLSRTIRQHGASGPEGVILRVPDRQWQGPVLLHELLHLYHARRLPGSMNNGTVEAAYTRAAEQKYWPVNSYVMSGGGEFFAMTASAVLHGQVMRPPRTRRNVLLRMPRYYEWLVREFGLQLEHN